ncbi:hypothetical protein [Emcibacter sp. SYSU 3D8]|uniref:hypothetical protein n=1 Tax=Emcibacter sp. SYSU 3D8 TaxID=3133969 RepID=UPI0031FE628F
MNSILRNLILVSAFMVPGLGTVAAEPATGLPEDVARELSGLLESSPENAINPAIFTLAGNNPAYADEIACVLIQYHGQAGFIERELFKVTPDPDVRESLHDAIRACSQKTGGYGDAQGGFNKLLVGGDFGTLENTADVLSPVQP